MKAMDIKGKKAQKGGRFNREKGVKGGEKKERKGRRTEGKGFFR